MNDNTTIPPIAPTGRWCILRTSPGRTLGLATALSAAGFTAWTPRQTQTRRRPRSKITFEVEVAIAPTFVFVRAEHVRDLAAAEAALVNPFPAFSIFRHGGRIPLIADGEVEGLRREEERNREIWERAQERARLKAERTKRKRKRLVLGQRVRFGEEGAFAGLSGTVEKGGDRFVLGAFGQGFRMKIATWLLSADDVEQTQPNLGAAA
ncbi:hypothetical protein HY78_18805 [Rhizorhabdus wittichii DC-6]|nr:hypothetical protein HY78_18805 [Rhizorhabdus wittichii DC-6]